MHATFTLRVDFTDEWYGADIDPERWDEASDLLLDIDGVTSCCLNHCCWIECEGFDGPPNSETVREFEQKIRRVIREVSI